MQQSAGQPRINAGSPWIGDIGKAELKTVSGGTLTAWMDGKWIALKDGKGGMSHVTQADVFQSNGVIHVIDTVVMPN